MLAGATVGALAWVRGAAHLSLLVVALISWMMSASGFRDGCRIGNIVTIRAQHSQSLVRAAARTDANPHTARLLSCLGYVSTDHWEGSRNLPVSVKCHFAPVSDIHHDPTACITCASRHLAVIALRRQGHDGSWAHGQCFHNDTADDATDAPQSPSSPSGSASGSGPKPARCDWSAKDLPQSSKRQLIWSPGPDSYPPACTSWHPQLNVRACVRADPGPNQAMSCPSNSHRLAGRARQGRVTIMTAGIQHPPLDLVNSAIRSMLVSVPGSPPPPRIADPNLS